MAIRKEDLYRLIDKLPSKDLPMVHHLLKRLADEDVEIHVDDSDISDKELAELEQINRKVDDGEVVDWEDIKRDFHL
ncbi:hypothetical protein [Alkalihalobacterium chitinilyticum]|uniref:Addiction module protein n=1 Tax=Alkalihalobacterium chitinilyticum TaxID=2980103 RepID=A0ABT5VFG5_9BACI|nr:hypothetical protein [Alkalihalobacterium chitinilyticum]MDE5414191.1 hypothetical protein [Alkalihalobacterium chitinilyticum]